MRPFGDARWSVGWAGRLHVAWLPNTLRRTTGSAPFSSAENRGNEGIVFKGRTNVERAVAVLHKSAEAVIPGLSRLQHYADWLERHPTSFIRAQERLDEK